MHDTHKFMAIYPKSTSEWLDDKTTNPVDALAWDPLFNGTSLVRTRTQRYVNALQLKRKNRKAAL